MALLRVANRLPVVVDPHSRQGVRAVHRKLAINATLIANAPTVNRKKRFARLHTKLINAIQRSHCYLNILHLPYLQLGRNS